jgi:hypothetical protein
MVDLCLEGARGGGKTTLMLLLAVQAERMSGAHFSGLVLRQDHRGTEDIRRTSRLLFHSVYGDDARFNQGSGIWSFPDGGTLEINQCEAEHDIGKYIGRNFTFLAADQCEMWTKMDHVNMIMSSMRGPKGVPIRCVWLMNSGGKGHTYCKKRWIHAEPLTLSTDAATKRPFIRVQSSFRDNSFLDREEYQRTLEAATAHDPALWRAWIDGEWNVAKGSYFAEAFSEQRCVLPDSITIDALARHPIDWHLGMDWGSSAPGVCLLLGRARHAHIHVNGLVFPRESILVMDEVASDDPADPKRGMGWNPERWADEIKTMCARARCRPRGAIDDAADANTTGEDTKTILRQLNGYGLRLTAAGKGRRAPGWQKLRTLLGDAGKVDRPGLYISRRCRYLLDTLPAAPIDPRNIEDIDGRWGEDHAIDALRYGVVWKPREIRSVILD